MKIIKLGVKWSKLVDAWLIPNQKSFKSKRFEFHIVLKELNKFYELNLFGPESRFIGKVVLQRTSGESFDSATFLKPYSSLENCNVYVASPLGYRLKVDTVYLFEYHVRGATSVLVVFDNPRGGFNAAHPNNTGLMRVGVDAEGADVWRAERTFEHTGRVDVYLQEAKDQFLWQTLCEYEVVEEWKKDFIVIVRLFIYLLISNGEKSTVLLFISFNYTYERFLQILSIGSY